MRPTVLTLREDTQEELRMKSSIAVLFLMSACLFIPSFTAADTVELAASPWTTADTYGKK